MSDRYTVLGSIAKGGMGVVYLGRMAGSAGFSRLVAIKRLHRELAAERGLVAMLVDEARMASRIRHANVIDTLDLVVYDGAFSLVLEYVEGESLSALIKRAQAAGEDVPRPIALAIMYGVLRGLDAAHESRSDDGAPLALVHRDVSPQNVLVGVDGVPRLIDFGVAKALGRLGTTRPGEVRGKYAYMSPEQLLSRPVTRQADVYSAGIMLWELLAHRRLFTGENFPAIINEVLKGDVPNPSDADPHVPPGLDAITKKATSRDLGKRYLTAREFLDELKAFPRASDDEVGAWVRRLAADELAKRQRLVQDNVPADDGHSVDDLIHDLRRNRSGGFTGLDPELLTSRTEAAAPLTAAFELPPQLEPSTFPVPSAAPERHGVTRVTVLAGIALLVLTTIGLARRAEPAVDAAPVRPAALTSETPSASTVAVPAPPPSSSNVVVPAPSEATSATAPVRSEAPPRRPKTAPPVTRYDPGNFR